MHENHTVVCKYNSQKPKNWIRDQKMQIVHWQLFGDWSKVTGDKANAT